jgi:serine protease inhibitor
MKDTSVERRLLLKAGFATALLGLINHASMAEILQSAEESDGRGDDGLLASQARLGENLIRHLARRRTENDDKRAGTNLIVSPASVACILSFVDLGASSELHAAIHRSLGFNSRANRAKTNRDIAALRDSVTAITTRGGKDGPLALANLLAFDRSVRPKQTVLFTASGAGADVLVDSLGNPEIIARINGWVKQKTRNLIPSIIEEAPQTLGLVAVNALYFKDKWKIPFEPSKTQSEPFQTASGKPVDVMMMHSRMQKFSFRQDSRFIATELAYADEDFKIVIVTTKSAVAQASDFAAVTDWLNGQGFEVKDGEIGLPRLSLSATEELLSPLDALGLRTARLAPDSLEGFSSANLVITRMVQKLELCVNEEGTEAAAATAVVTTRAIRIDNHVKMIVDKPFVFALRDQKTGLILFMGYVGSPQP